MPRDIVRESNTPKVPKAAAPLTESATKTAVKAKAAPVKAPVKAKAVKATAKVTEDEDAPF